MTDQEFLERRIDALVQDLAQERNERVKRELTAYLRELRKQWTAVYGTE